MNGKKARALRKQACGDPDLNGRLFAKEGNLETVLHHPQSFRGQYREAKKKSRSRSASL
ncbi:MAG: hypothetical protein AB1585_10640 [Thermodesulfobacteriota bacterium]